jgi:hypothetical protein
MTIMSMHRPDETAGHRISCHHTTLHLCKVRTQRAVGQLRRDEAAQRVLVLQRQLEEAWVPWHCLVQCSPCCGAKPAPSGVLLCVGSFHMYHGSNACSRLPYISQFMCTTRLHKHVPNHQQAGSEGAHTLCPPHGSWQDHLGPPASYRCAAGYQQATFLSTMCQCPLAAGWRSQPSFLER